MRMFSSWKCLDVLLLLITLSTSTSLSPNENPKCEILLNLYPPDIHVTEILYNCKNRKLQEPFFSYCVELVNVQKDVNSCGLGQLLQHVTDNVYKDIVSKSLAVPSIKEPICEVFKKLNASLYDLYLKNPGFGKQLSTNIFCPLFCKTFKNECEILLRTYWIKKILFFEASIVKDKSENAAKDKPKNAVKPGNDAGGNAVKPGNDAGGNADLQDKNQPPPAVLPQEAEPKSGSQTDIATKNQPINVGEQNKPKLEVEHTTTSNIATDKVKSPEIHITTTVLANKDLHHNNSIGTTPKESDKDAMTTNNLSVVNKPVNHDDSGNNQHIVEPKAKVKDNNNDGSEMKSQLVAVTAQKQNANTDETIIVDGHIPFDPDRTMDDDVATTMEKGKYQDNSQDGPEVPLAVQTDFKDNTVDNNLQSDEAIIRKQTNNVPVFPEEEDSHFFAYFLTIVVVCIAGYLVFHNKQKIIALIIEGRHERRRRPNNGTYKRLDSKDNTKATSHIIF